MELRDEVAEARSGRGDVVVGTREASCFGISPSKLDIPVGPSKNHDRVASSNGYDIGTGDYTRAHALHLRLYVIDHI